MIRVAITTSSSRLNQALHALLAERGRFEIMAGNPGLDEFRARDGRPDRAMDVVAAADVIVTDVPALAVDDLGSATVLLSDEEDLFALPRALRGGLALLPASASAEQVVAAIEATAAGLAVVHPYHVASLPARAGELTSPGEDPLTPREREVLHLLAAGLGNKEIGGRLAISDHTAKFHVSQILAKLNAGTRAEAVSIAMRRGLVPL